MVTFPKGESFKYVLQIHFPVSNNAAEYEALLHGLRIATTLSICQLNALGDSLLIINQAAMSDHVWMTKCCYTARSSAN
jgi:ribonuclease HI